jgi:hypothetical protein
MKLSDRLKGALLLLTAGLCFVVPILLQIAQGTHLIGALGVVFFLFGMMFLLKK